MEIMGSLRRPSVVLLTFSMLLYAVPILIMLFIPEVVSGDGPAQDAGKQIMWWPYFIPSLALPYYWGKKGVRAVALALAVLAVIFAVMPFSHLAFSGMRIQGAMVTGGSLVLAICVGCLAESSLRSRRSAEAQNRQLKSLFEASELFAFSLDPQHVLEQCLAIIRKSLGFDYADVWLLEDEGRILRKAASNVPPVFGAADTFPVDFCLPGLALSSEEGVYIEDPLTDERITDKTWVNQLGHSSEAALPLIYQGEKLGVIILANMERYDFTPERRELMQTFANQMTLAIKNAKLYREMEKKALIDELTELYNHRYFQEMLDKELKRAQRENQPLSLLLMDLDNFKLYNDTFGHPEGDKLLRQFGQVLQTAVRESDLTARYGGDEFVVILPNTDESGAQQLVARITEKISHHNFPGFSRMPGGQLSVSIGSATYPVSAKNKVELVKQADDQLYKIKETRRKMQRVSS
ncbi:diguanylate cyclase [Dethiobacter alkaliphilus]|nr:diguanylate cyclase [Dethiobacter alkaliphilus]MCW3491409.1 diguanylate cyclase [Dethiobacter alkaliphilus]